MRAIDIGIFLLIFQVVGNLIAVNYASLMGFGTQPLLKTHVGKDVEEIGTEMWNRAQTYATIIMAAGLIAGTIASAVFGQYYVVALLAMATVITIFIPAVRVYVTALPTLLIALGIPAEITGVILVIYNLVLVLSILIWLSGRSLREYG